MPFVVFFPGRNTLSCGLVDYHAAAAHRFGGDHDHRYTLPLVALLITGGYSGPLSQGTPETLSVRSEPAATVLVMGRDMGMTPQTIPVKAVFPAAYPPEQEALYGRITP